jgi:uncharacterized glyoxalase superfamily protein PhnB
MLSPILATSDVDASIAFYTQKLGFEHAWSMPPNADGKTDFACVRLAGSEVLLGVTEGFVELEDMAKRGTGIELYIELPADFDLDGLYERAQAAGVNITRPLEDRDWGERTFHFSDPDGYRYMLAKPLPKQN